ncbi:hypothetical protein NPIL_463911, partial [Nephila pilipes]
PPKSNLTILTIKSAFGHEIFTEEEINFVPVTSTPNGQSPLLQQILPSPPSVRALSPLQEDVISTLNQIVSFCFFKYIEKLSTICAHNSTDLTSSLLHHLYEYHLPLPLFLLPSPALLPEVQKDHTNNNQTHLFQIIIETETEVTEQISSTKISDCSKVRAM